MYPFLIHAPIILFTVISDERKRLLTQLDHQGNSSGAAYDISTGDLTIDKHIPSKSKITAATKKVSRCSIMTAALCLIIIVVTIVYSHLILNAIHSNEYSGEMTINNISQRLDKLSLELHQITDTVIRDNKNIKLDLETLKESIGNSVKTQDVLKRLGEVSRKEDQLLLEQIQTDRKVNLKLEVLQNGINIIKAQIEADKMAKSDDELKLSQLESENRELESKLEHLRTILSNTSQLDAGELRTQIENDNELSPKTEDVRSIWVETVDLWNKLVKSDSVTSSSVGHTTKVTCILACTMTTFISTVYRFSLFN